MKWKDVILGALVSLLVTVAGGLAIYHFTKEPELSKKENLEYSISKGGVFEGGSSKLALLSINLENSGGVAAENVDVMLSFEKAEVKDISLDSHTGSKDSKREITDKSASLVFERVLPTESLTINLLLSSPETPKISIRSTASIAKIKELQLSRKAKVNSFLELGIPFAGLLLLLSLLSMLKFVRGSGTELTVSKNNAGFLLMHAGLVDQAHDIFSSAIADGRYDALTLSNFSLCKALKGDIEAAQKLSMAANYRDLIWHGKAVVLFNEALTLIAQNKNDEAYEKLEKSISKSPKTIRKYCNRSVHLDAVKNDERFAKLINNA